MKLCVSPGFPRSISIIGVIYPRNPFKVTGNVIVLVLINMINFCIVVRVINKRQGNKPMNMYRSSITFFVKFYFQIAMLGLIWFKNLVPIVPNTSHVTNLVYSFISPYVLPYFFQFSIVFTPFLC